MEAVHYSTATQPGMLMHMRSPFTRFLVLGDGLAITAFVILGQVFHATIGAESVMRAAVQVLALVVPYEALAWLLGAYPPLRPASLPEVARFLVRAGLAWLFAAPLGLFIRAQLLGQPTVLLIFALASLGFGALFVIGWRGIYALVALTQPIRPSASLRTTRQGK